MSDIPVKADEPPVDLTNECAAFFAMQQTFEGPLVVHLDTTSPLERLGPSPFPKAGFPLLGFLETVYDHIATQAV